MKKNRKRTESFKKIDEDRWMLVGSLFQNLGAIIKKV